MKRPASKPATGLLSVAVSLILGGAISGACAAKTPPPRPVVNSINYGEPARPSGGVFSYTGQVYGVDRVPVTNQNDLNVKLRLTLDKQAKVSVELGPGWYIKRHGLEFRQQELVTVIGRRTYTDDGRAKLIAHEVHVGNQKVKLRDAKGVGLWELVEPPILPSSVIHPATASASAPEAPAPASGEPAPTRAAPSPSATSPQ